MVKRLEEEGDLPHLPRGQQDSRLTLAIAMAKRWTQRLEQSCMSKPARQLQACKNRIPGVRVVDLHASSSAVGGAVELSPEHQGHTQERMINVRTGCGPPWQDLVWLGVVYMKDPTSCNHTNRGPLRFRFESRGPLPEKDLEIFKGEQRADTAFGWLVSWCSLRCC